MAHEVVLTVGTTSLAVDTWDRYTIRLSMMDPGSPWTFTMWRNAGGGNGPRTAWTHLREVAKLASPMRFTIDGAVQMAGSIETHETRADRSGATLTLSGRDLAGPALSWDAEPTLALRGLPLSTALERIFNPLGIPVTIGLSAEAARSATTGEVRGTRGASTSSRTRSVDTAHPRPGEKVWQVAEAITRRLGYLLWTGPDTAGRLAVIVDAPGYSTAPLYSLERRFTGGELAGNILRGAESLNLRDVPTEVIVYTGGARGAAISARQMRLVSNTALLNRGVNRGFLDAESLGAQPRHVQDTRSRDLERSEREAMRVIFDGMRRFRTYTCTVAGHGQRGKLYAVNSMARVRDDVCTSPTGAPLDEEMLVVEVEFNGSRQDGQTTTLTLVPKGSVLVDAD